jgi:effector-binding domain-containing protein
MAEFEIRDVPRQDTAVVHVSTEIANIGSSMGEAFHKAMAAVGKAGVAPAGPPMCKYLAYSGDRVEYEAGVPVAAPFAGDDDVRAGEVGGCQAAVAMHVGPYDKLGETYGKLQAWIESQGKKPSAVMWESYLSDPQTTDPSEIRTEIFWPFE